MSITPKKHLFWFLKDGIQLQLGEPSVLDMYVGQVITRGGTEDVKELLKIVDLERMRAALKRMERFLPYEIKEFWEDFIGDSQ